MGEKETIWYLCAQCALGLKSTLRLEETNFPHPGRPGKEPCRVCHRECYGAWYKVRYKTKGE